MKIAVHCNHIDMGGGGTYSHFLIRALQRYGEVYITNDHPPFVSYWGDKLDLPRWDGGTPDLFVCIDHRGDIPPMGKRNLRMFFYPFSNMMNARSYDAAIVMNPFVGRATVRNMFMYPYIVPIGLDDTRYRVSLDKRNVLLCVSNFFKESDGHSKHQDKIIEWFGDEKLYNDWELIFVGGGHPDYYNYCIEKAKDIPQIRFTGSIEMAQIVPYYSQAKFLIHANGWGRTDESQTEHFGIVAVEAMLSGCEPLVHNSGGCREIKGVRTWNDWGDLTPMLHERTDPIYLRKCGEVYSPSRMREALGECLRGIQYV